MIRVFIFIVSLLSLLLPINAIPINPEASTSLTLTSQQLSDLASGIRPPRNLYKILRRRLAERNIRVTKRELRKLGQQVYQEIGKRRDIMAGVLAES
ncbi:uncharacterized protein VTP21DRAFT_6543 [Calcarisporiella thermophila]|uniref:uncharacterized protein n=1 Tax=Calcarisporiella thermophila TaxID=911321 RepID=UPI003741F1C1